MAFLVHAGRPADETSEPCADQTQNHSQDQAHMLVARHNSASHETNHQSKDRVSNHVYHTLSVFLSCAGWSEPLFLRPHDGCLVRLNLDVFFLLPAIELNDFHCVLAGIKLQSLHRVVEFSRVPHKPAVHVNRRELIG